MKTPKNTQTPFKDIDFKILPHWDGSRVKEAFTLIRDYKFLSCPNIASNKRAIPWRFVDNGCFARAAISASLLKEKGFQSVMKVFVFGNFKFKTHWTKSKHITFKDHVAIGFRADDNIIIFDPSVSYEKPLLIKEWLDILTSDSHHKDVNVSICTRNTLSHNSDCEAVLEKDIIGFRQKNTDREVINYPLTLDCFLSEFLVKEYINYIELGLNPNNYIK